MTPQWHIRLHYGQVDQVLAWFDEMDIKTVPVRPSHIVAEGTYANVNNELIIGGDALMMLFRLKWNDACSGYIREHNLRLSHKYNYDCALTGFMPEITRLEVIGNGIRLLSLWNLLGVELSVQDDGRTLKVLLKADKPEVMPMRLFWLLNKDRLLAVLRKLTQTARAGVSSLFGK